MKFLEQIESWEIILLVLALLVLGPYIGRQIDFENMFKKDSPVPVHMGGAVVEGLKLDEVKVVPIPTHVYDSLEQDTRFKKYLTGNHKYVLMFTYPGCPYSRAFEQAFTTLFNQGDFAEYYRRRVITVGRTSTISCPGGRDLNCATAWVYHYCFGNVCIFNPLQKQAVVDSSHRAKQLKLLLEYYKEW